MRQIRSLRWVRSISVLAFFVMGLIGGGGLISTALAWHWDQDDMVEKDDCEVQQDAYRKQVENGLSLQDRLVALDRLIRLCQIHHHDTKALETERDQVFSDENAIQTVSVLSRQKSRDLFEKAFEQIRLGQYKAALDILNNAEHLNPGDKIISELRQRTDAVVMIIPQAPSDPATGDLIRRGVSAFLQNEPSQSLNYLLYAQQKEPTDKNIQALVELAKHTFPNESDDILDARLNLIDQKLQRALERIYAGDYLEAAKECEEVLDLEPQNTLALTRLGSVYYAMGQVKQARTYWQQALALDPKNDVLSSFLQQTVTEADRAPAQALTYKVQKGDTLQVIAQKVYKNKAAWRKLYSANRAYLKNPYQLSVGQILVLPPNSGNTP